MKNGWTQKQLNFIGYYVSKDREPNNEKIQYTNYINENSIPKPTSSQELQILINNIRSNHGLSHIEDISTAIPECEDLFSNEPETSEPESNPSAPDSVPQTNTSDSEPQTDEPTINEFLEVTLLVLSVALLQKANKTYLLDILKNIHVMKLLQSKLMKIVKPLLKKIK